jgi:acetolactate synthase-1/2/3 large subunit
VLVDQLRIHSTRVVFCVPGESYLPALQALSEHSQEIDLVVARQEGGAAFMAAAYGRLTGRPGVAFVTRGPGAANAAIGLHTAAQDSAPMLLLIGQVPRSVSDREAFQEIDDRQFFGGIAKWVGRAQDGARLPELVSRAFQTAVSGRPGPVVLELPEDVLNLGWKAADGQAYSAIAPYPSPDDVARFRDLLSTAATPVVLVGGGIWGADAARQLQSLAEGAGLPVISGFRRQDYIDNYSSSYVGHLGIRPVRELASAITAADLIIALGGRLGGATTSNHTLVKAPRPDQTLIHIHPSAEELGRVYQADLQIEASPVHFISAVGDLTYDGRWSAWTEQLRRSYLRSLASIPESPGRLSLSTVVRALQGTLPADAIIASGAGNFAGPVHRYFQWREYGTQLAPTSGAMGYGLPAAVAAKAAFPDRVVVAITGDGDFLMTGQELATAMRHKLAIVILLANNGTYGTIELHQQDRGFDPSFGTRLLNPDFALFARSFGALGTTVAEMSQFRPALEEALSAGRPALIELRLPGVIDYD